MTEAKPQRGARIFDQALTRLGGKIVDFKIDSLDSQPQARKQGIFKGPGAYLAELGLAGTVLFAACNAPATGTPGETSQPSESPTATMTFFPTESPFATPSPTPTVEITPSPTPSPTPEATQSIETIPLIAGGSAGKNGGGVTVRNGTVVAIERNPDGTVKDFAITVPGTKISRTCDKLIEFNCSYRAVTFWVNVTDRIILVDVTQNKIIDRGPAAVSSSIVLGKDIPLVYIPILEYPGMNYNVDVPGNLASLHKLDTSIGKSLPRANRIFTFNALSINIYKQ